MSIGRKQNDDAEIDISQSNILSKLAVYFKRQQRNKDCLIHFGDDDDDGHCCGFAVLAVYGTWLELITKDDIEPIGAMDDYAWFENVLLEFSRWDEVVDVNCEQLRVELRYEIERLYSLVRYFQAPLPFGNVQSESEKLLMDTKNRRFIAEYSLAGFFSQEDLTKPIMLAAENGCMQRTNAINVLINEYKMVMIHSDKHVTSVIRHGNRYFHYDSNSKKGRLLFSGAQDALVNHIFEAHYNATASGTLCFRVMDDEVRPRASYPAQAVLLDAIGQGAAHTDSVVEYEMHHASLLHAAWAGCILSASYHLQHLSERKVAINIPDKSGLSSLHYAAASGNVELVELLIKEGAQVNQQDPYGVTPLYIAVTISRVRVVRCLLAAGANPNLKSNIGVGPLYKAVHNNHTLLARILLQSGASPTGACEMIYMPLHRACELGNLTTVKLLVQRGAIIDEIDQGGRAPLSLALQQQQYHIAQYLFSLSGIKVGLTELLDIERQKRLLSEVNELNERKRFMSYTRSSNGTQIPAGRVLSTTALLMTVMQPNPVEHHAPAVLPVDEQIERKNQDKKTYQAMHQQPSKIMRDPHCSLPGHYGKRMCR